jgi:hypothetical protein
MVGEILLLLKNTVNDHLAACSGGEQFDQGQVLFLESEKVDVLDFKLGAITLLLVNLEEEHSMRAADPHRLTLADGTTQRVEPPILLNLYVLFVARFKDYAQSLRYLSRILQFFQGRRILDHENTPALSEKVEKLTMELLTLPLAEQNHLWGILRTAYQPSLLYKVRMVVFRDEEGVTGPAVTETMVRTNL